MSKKAQVKTDLNLDKVETKKVEDTKSYSSPLLFGKKNYQLMLLGLIVIFVGYGLMMGTNNDVESLTATFPKEEVYSVRRIVVAPIVIIVGFLIEIYAILSAKKEN
ncbi:MAG: DUF3098 domain-containing protein [Chitinophagales bacterium]|nr:DUF3098 domain-containing protein [Chitinophagales bacterium]